MSSLETTLYIIGKAHEKAEKLNLGKDKPGKGTIKCPECGKKIFFTVAGLNGHIWGCCKTKDCIQWME